MILDLCDHRPVAYVLSAHNNNQLVFDTFDQAVKNNPGAHPIIHSDRGFQYTSRVFYQKLIDAGMIQSMSRVAQDVYKRQIPHFAEKGWEGIVKKLKRLMEKDLKEKEPER